MLAALCAMGVPCIAPAMAMAQPAVAMRLEPMLPRMGDSVRIARLAALGRLWGEVKYFHPYLAYRPIEWDSAFFAAYPLVNRAHTAGEYAAAVSGMLGALGDPVTRVISTAHTAATPAAGAAVPFTSWLPDSTLLVRFAALGDLSEFETMYTRLDSLASGMAPARALILDFRGTALAASDEEGSSVRDLFRNTFPRPFDNYLVAARLTGPAERRRMHSGFAPQSGVSSGGYSSAFYTLDGAPIVPAPGARARPIVAIVDAESSLPDVVVALQRAGLASIVATGGAPAGGDGATHMVTLTDGVRVLVRTAEPADGRGVLPDTVLSRNAPDADVLAAARVLLHVSSSPRAVSGAPLAPPAATRAEAMYTPYPDSAVRVLAAYRFWTAIQYFYPYKNLIGEDWNAVLPGAIARMEAAGDSTAFALAVAEMVQHIHDSHGFVSSAALQAYRGAVPTPLFVRMIEGRPLVTAVRDTALDIAVGDEIVAVDGEPAALRLARYERTFAASTPWALARDATRSFLNGADGTDATLTLRDVHGRVREARVKRQGANRQRMARQREGPVMRLLPGGIGYADLDRLTVPQVDSMFERFKDAPAIIFDMRGYPNGTAWSIAPRLALHQGTAAASFRRNVLTSPDTSEHTTLEVMQTLPATTKPRYAGRTVMLIDERTQSQAEHTGLFLEVANGTVFIGSPSAGANGDVTSVALPGRMGAGFSGHDVRHADGRQLQRVGLQPRVLVRPTVAGIRANRDEVLDAALRYLRHPSARR